MPWTELIGTALGLLAVLLLIRQKLLTWPVGAVYALLSTYVFLRTGLYGQALLHVVFLAMNLYGWWFWATQGKGDEQLPVQRGRPALLSLALLAGLLGSGLLAFLFNSMAGAQLIWADSVIAGYSLVAIWLQARKILESWLLWFVIDVGSVALYGARAAAGEQGLYLYAGLYLVYLGLAVWGYVAWRRTLQPA